MPFSQRAVKFALTYARCALSKEYVADFFDDKWGNDVEWIVVAQEHHRDGGLHLHVGIRFIAQRYWTDPGWADLVGPVEDAYIGPAQEDRIGRTYHGNYQVMKNVKFWLRYLMKEDPELLQRRVDVSLIVNGTGNVFSVVAALATSGQTLRQINTGHAGFVMQHKRKIEEYSGWITETPAVCSSEVKGVWIWGESGFGKTHFALREYPGAFQKAANKWWDGYAGEQYVILDDLNKRTGEMIAYYLKKWMDRFAPPRGEIKGSTIQLRHIKFVVTSQWSIESMFDCIEDRQAVSRRCEIVHFHEEREFY